MTRATRQAAANVLAVMEEMLHSPACWTQQASALDRHGNITTPTAENAFSWDLVGCMRAASTFTGASPEVRIAVDVALRTALHEKGASVSLYEFNNSPDTTYEMVDMVVRDAREILDPVAG